jgi:hypothetical protein
MFLAVEPYSSRTPAYGLASRQHIETRPLVTFCAVRKALVAKCTAVVMTCPATDPADRAMLHGGRMSYLSSLSGSGDDVVTFVAAHALAYRMIAVAEYGFEHISRRRRAAVRSKRVTDAA